MAPGSNCFFVRFLPLTEDEQMKGRNATASIAYLWNSVAKAWSCMEMERLYGRRASRYARLRKSPSLCQIQS